MTALIKVRLYVKEITIFSRAQKRGEKYNKNSTAQEEHKH